MSANVATAATVPESRVQAPLWSSPNSAARKARIVALDVRDREAILRVLAECPEELLELRATLLQEHVWRQHKGLW